MITQFYRERTAADLKNRISKVLLNGNETKIVEVTIQGPLSRCLLIEKKISNTLRVCRSLMSETT